MSNSDIPNQFSVKTKASAEEIASYERLLQLMQASPIPPNERLANLGVYLNRSLLSRMLFLDHLYRKILPLHGIIVEFGVRWGQDLTLLTLLRSLYEPYNYGRRIVGFDTFVGFPSVALEDRPSAHVKAGAYAVTEGYEIHLENVLQTHETLAPRGHLQKFEIVKGDASATLPCYLERHPETIIALAYFDMDIFEPTRDCLKLIAPHLTKGSIIGFDELGHDEFPGETIALKEVWGLDRFTIRREPNAPWYPSFLVYE